MVARTALNRLGIDSNRAWMTGMFQLIQRYFKSIPQFINHISWRGVRACEKPIGREIQARFRRVMNSCLVLLKNRRAEETDTC
ncbi:hypothetical protein TNCV_304571 [Trichonephila clavipes]|nr:hypothetical protein TNCV_304571 [Trichonephila clavipes]